MKMTTASFFNGFGRLPLGNLESGHKDYNCLLAEKNYNLKL